MASSDDEVSVEQFPFFLGQQFESKDALKVAVLSYCTSTDKSYIVEQSNNNRWQIRCPRSTCPFFLHFRSKGPVFEIVSLRTHCAACLGKCVTSLKSSDAALLMSSEVVREEITSPTTFIQSFSSKFEGVVLSYSKSVSALAKSQHLTLGNKTESYDCLEVLVNNLKERNPGSVTEVIAEEQCFDRAFIALGACISGFVFCRRLIFFDGTHIKTKHKGTLLIATSIDAEGKIFPLAFAAVRSESIDTWTWFMTFIRDTFNVYGSFTLISDRQKGLLEAITNIFGEGVHQGFCINHLADNVSKHGGAIAVNWLWSLVKIKTQQEFMIRMQRCWLECPKAAKYLTAIPVEFWADYSFPGKRYGHYTNNAVESVNSWIRSERELPISQMFDSIVKKLAEKFSERREKGLKCKSEVPLKIILEMRTAQLRARSFGLRNVDNGVFEVVDGIKTFDVDMNNKTCACHHWQDLGTPWEHVMRVLRHTNENPEKFVDEMYFIENYRKTYESRLFTANIADVLKEEKVNKMEPPKEIVPVGRPAIARKRKGHDGGAPKPKKVNTNEGAPRRRYRCSKCGSLDHNKARCDQKE
ncbi:hypothetical protein RCL1_008847 [Eukaryota sp. TZLM3-RCL]